MDAAMTVRNTFKSWMIDGPYESPEVLSATTAIGHLRAFHLDETGTPHDPDSYELYTAQKCDDDDEGRIT